VSSVRMCNAYAKIGLLVPMYRTCSLCLVDINLTDCPTYELLQVLHVTMITTDKNTLKQKNDTFIQVNHITHINKDPTDFYKKKNSTSNSKM